MAVDHSHLQHLQLWTHGQNPYVIMMISQNLKLLCRLLFKEHFCSASLLLWAPTVLPALSNFLWIQSPIPLFSAVLSFISPFEWYSRSVQVRIEVWLALVTKFGAKKRRWNHMLRVNWFLIDPFHEHSTQVLYIAHWGTHEGIWRRHCLRFTWSGNVW